MITGFRQPKRQALLGTSAGYPPRTSHLGADPGQRSWSIARSRRDLERQRTAHDDPGPAAARVVRDLRHVREAHATVEGLGASVFEAGQGLQRGRAALRRGGGEPLVQAPAQSEGPGVVADGHEVDVTVARGGHETEEVPDYLAVFPGHEGRVAELIEEDRVMERAWEVPVAPEALEGPEDLGQVAVAREFDRDLAHDETRPSRGAMIDRASASLARACRK